MSNDKEINIPEALVQLANRIAIVEEKLNIVESKLDKINTIESKIDRIDTNVAIICEALKQHLVADNYKDK